MIFQNINNNNSKEDLKALGYLSGHEVMVLFNDGSVRWGELYFEEKYQCLYDTELRISSEKSIPMDYAVGICALTFI